MYRIIYLILLPSISFVFNNDKNWIVSLEDTYSGVLN